eukprot:gb/GECH01012280.1/.p1 GENE.gb/GECH01012280.1/~~gb/GECH01012280.1/.p1  ORF type:complete len:269 (+),score=68.11 gb/GECH01012280.1/:1-807(+)
MSTVPNPLDSMKDDQKAKFKQFKEEVSKLELDEDQRYFLNELTYYRYLKGLNWNVPKAKEQLQETLQWRKEKRPQDYSITDLSEVAKMGHFICFGKDKEHRPIIYVRLGNDTMENTEENSQLKIKYVIYVMEQLIPLMEENVYDITWIIDAKNASLSMKAIKATINQFVEVGNHYTERLAFALVVNAHWSLSWMWSAIKPFLEASTAKKYKFIKNQQELLDYVDESQLLDDYGGQARYEFSYDAMLEQEQKVKQIIAERKGKSDKAEE